MITPTPQGASFSFFGIQGRDGGSPLFQIPASRCAEAKNIDWYGSSLARRRAGSDGLQETGGTAFSTGIRSLFRHVPGDDQGAAELWGVDGTGFVKRLTGGTSWANVTLDDAISGNYSDVNGVSLNGKFYFAYNSTQNRLHVYDPADAKVRRCGVATGSNAPTVALNGAGAITDTRTYKVVFQVQSGGVVIRQSNPTPASGSQAYAAQQGTVTKPTTPSTENITHWACYAASTDGIYRLIATTAIGTATCADNNATLTGALIPEAGANYPPPSAKYIVTDDTRLIMGGAWETTAGDSLTPTSRRIWWTSRLGSSDIGDDERVSSTTLIKNYDDIEESVSGISTPTQGSFYVFSYDGQWKFVPTGNVNAPYQRIRINGGRGCIQHKTIVIGEDEDGDPAIYWLSRFGPTRICKTGQQVLDRDVDDLWATVNLDASVIVAHAVFHAGLHQVWFYVATGSSTFPNLKLVFDCRLGRFFQDTQGGGVRNGWSHHDGESAYAFCSVMFSQTLGVSMSRLLKPYIGYAASNGSATSLWICDQTSLGADAGIGFQAYIESRPVSPWGMGSYGGVYEGVLVAKALPTTTIQMAVSVDEGARTQTTSSISLADTSDGGVATSVFKKVPVNVGQANSVRIRFGDASAVNTGQWNLHAFVVPSDNEGQR